MNIKNSLFTKNELRTLTRVELESLVIELQQRVLSSSSAHIATTTGMSGTTLFEESLQDREERLTALMNHNPSLIFSKDDQGRYVYLNNSYERQFVGSKDWYGKNDFDFWPKESAELFIKDDQITLNSGKMQQFLEDSTDKEGKRYCWLCYKFPFTDSKGKKFIGGIGIDATERVIAQEALQRSEKKYYHQTEELTAANKELESFSYSISHDLRAPIQAMKGLCTIMLEDYGDKLDPELQGYLRRIVANSDKMGYLVDDMLSLSKISRQEIIVQQINLSKIAETVINELQQGDPTRKVVTSIAPNIVAIGDSRLMSIALSNLIGNAWKYSSKTPDAHIEFGETLRNGETIYYVRDNGAGFDMKFATKLFEPFKRLHSETEFSGTGIGLAIVKRVIEKHHGQVWTESEPGKGATFYFKLSLVLED